MQLYWIILVLPTLSYMLKYTVQKTRNINSKIIISMHGCPTNLKSQRDVSISISESVMLELCSFLLSYKKFIQTKCFLMGTLTWHGLWLRLCKKEQSWSQTPFIFDSVWILRDINITHVKWDVLDLPRNAGNNITKTRKSSRYQT